MTPKTTDKDSPASKIGSDTIFQQVAWSLLGFSLLCFITFFSIGSEKQLQRETFEREGGTLGPIEIKEDNTIYRVDVHQNLSPNSWSYVNVSLLDADRKELFTVSDQLWAEGGVDGGYAWRESDKDMTVHFNIADKGTYYILFEPELSASVHKIGQMTVRTWKKTFSRIPFIMAAVISLLLGIILFIFKNFFLSF